MALIKEKSKLPGALFIFDTWDKNKYGLPAFHRYLVKTLGKKKGKSLRLYSTVLSDEISESHKQDAEKLGVTLLMAERRKRIIPEDDPVRLTWLHNFESYYPEFQTLSDIQYIIGYAPKTGDAAADIRDGAFPSAQLVLINHASPENDCALVHRENLGEFEQRMLNMATEADLIFSMGPKHYGFFQNQYRVSIGKKDLQGTPHEEILPVPSKSFFKTKVTLGKSDTNCHVIFTYGTFDNANLVHGLKGVASAVGSVARTKHDDFRRLPDWDIHGVNKDFQEAISKLLKTNLSGDLVAPRLFQDLTMENLTTKLCQSHICLPIRCYGEYSFDGLEALALGVPLLIAEYSHLASFIKKYFPFYEKHYVVRSSEQYPQMIKYILQNTKTSFEIADAQKTEFKESKQIYKSYKRFAAMLAYDLDSDNDNSDTMSSKSKDQAATDEEKQLKRQTLVPSEKESPDEEYSQNHQMGDRRSLLNTSHESERAAHYPCGSNFAAESSMHRGTRGNDEFTVKIKVNEDDFNKEIRRLEGQILQSDDETLQEEGQQSEGERQALEKQKRKIQNILEQIKKSYKERVYTILNQEERKLFLRFLLTHCNNNHAIFINVEEGCLALLLKFRFLQNLSKFRGSCLTGRFTKPLEQYLVTKEMRLAAKQAKIDLQLVPVYDDAAYQDIADFFIERDGGSDVTEDTTSSDDDGVDAGWLEAPFVVKCHPEDEGDKSTKASDQLHVQALLAETEEKLHTNSRPSSSMEISALQNERDNAIKEQCVVENRYRELLTERETYSKLLTQMKMELKRQMEDKKSLENEIYTLKSKERERKIEISELELNRHKHFTDKSQEKVSEPGNEDDSDQKFESKQRESQLQKLKPEKETIVEGRLQIATRGKTPCDDGIPSWQDNEISLQRKQEGQLRVSPATTGGTNNTVSREITRVSWSRVSNVKDTHVNENESRSTQQLVSPLHLSKEQSTNLKADGEVTEPARVGEDLDNGCTSNRYSGIFQTLYHKWMGQKCSQPHKKR
ncbi:uncharacterized protein [Ptychodera flava]|uniref:uncharacterized protein n=1 Tax=Ptychodera flava TaxID=63121 RepID=UPI00396A09A0